MKRKLFCLSLLSLFMIGCENVNTPKGDIENKGNSVVENNDDKNNAVDDSNENNGSTNIEDNSSNENSSNNELPDNNIEDNNTNNDGTEDSNSDTNNTENSNGDVNNGEDSNTNENNNEENNKPEEEKVLPLITKIDLTDADLVFVAASYPDGEEPNENMQLSGIYDSNQLYKVNNNNQIERVKISSESFEDDLAFTTDCDFTLYDVDANYFRFYVHANKSRGTYLVNKKTGECRSIDSYSFHFETYHNKTSSYRKYVNVDGQGNCYGMGDAKPEQYSSNWITTQLIKTTVGENFELDTVRVSKEDHPYRIEENFAVDKDGNAAYVATCYEKGCHACAHYITADGKDLPIETNEKSVGEVYTSEGSWTYEASTKGFWQGYDGEIYTNEEGYICKLVPNKDSNGEIVSVDQVRVSDKTDIPNSFFSSEVTFVFFDDLQEIYLLDQGFYKKGNENNRPASLYCIYGSQIGKKVYSGLYYASHGQSGGYLAGYPIASGDSIYIARYNTDGSGYIVTRINVKNNFATSTITFGYDIYYNSRMAKDNKVYTTSSNYKHVVVYDFETKQETTMLDDSCQLKYIDDISRAIEI